MHGHVAIGGVIGGEWQPAGGGGTGVELRGGESR